MRQMGYLFYCCKYYPLLPCNRTLLPCHCSEGRILPPEATWMFSGRRYRPPHQGDWCSCTYHCHGCRECNNTSSPIIWNENLFNAIGIRFHLYLLTWLEVFESDVATDAPETNSGEINRVERINEIILMTDHLQSTDSIYRYSEFGIPIGSCHM